MRILVVGGGSGGHITPAVAVVREILAEKPRARVEFWTNRKYYKNVVKITTEIGAGPVASKKQYVKVRMIASGKFRRYNWTAKEYFENFGIFMKDVVAGNIVGLLGFITGLLQAFFRLSARGTRPDVIFLKGGFVGLPVGLVAGVLKIPYVIHESDAVPGLANRILKKRAAAYAVGAKGTDDPKAVFTGTPVAAEFRPVGATRQNELKQVFGFDAERPLTVVTGGSQGSLHIDEAMREILPEMLKFTSVGLVAGRAHYGEMVDLKEYEDTEKFNFRLWEFNSTMDELMGAADVVVSRAGATTISELSALKKAVVLVPFEKLPGGHQSKNAERLEGLGAALVVRDDKMVEQPGLLLEAVKSLVQSPKKREEMAKILHAEAEMDAAKKLADIIIGIGTGKVMNEVADGTD